MATKQRNSIATHVPARVRNLYSARLMHYHCTLHRARGVVVLVGNVLGHASYNAVWQRGACYGYVQHLPHAQCVVAWQRNTFATCHANQHAAVAHLLRNNSTTARMVGGGF